MAKDYYGNVNRLEFADFPPVVSATFACAHFKTKIGKY